MIKAGYLTKTIKGLKMGKTYYVLLPRTIEKIEEQAIENYCFKIALISDIDFPS